MNYNTIPRGSQRVLQSYYVTREGQVYSFISGKFLKIQDNGIGYKQVWLRDKDGRSRWYKVSRLVAEAFIPRKGNVVRFRDGDRGNVAVGNLYWV